MQCSRGDYGTTQSQSGDRQDHRNVSRATSSVAESVCRWQLERDRDHAAAVKSPAAPSKKLAATVQITVDHQRRGSDRESDRR